MLPFLLIAKESTLSFRSLVYVAFIWFFAGAG